MVDIRMNIDNSIRKIIGNKKRGGRNDLDYDGVPNKKDCQPRNTMRQDMITDILNDPKTIELAENKQRLININKERAKVNQQNRDRREFEPYIHSTTNTQEEQQVRSSLPKKLKRVPVSSKWAGGGWKYKQI